MRKRRGFSVLETVIAIAVLAVSVAAMMQFNTGETRAIEMSEERLTAIMLLGEIQQTLNNKDYSFYATFPNKRENFDTLAESVVLEHPTVFNHKDTTVDTPFAKELRKTLERMQVRRYVLFETFVDSGGREGGVVTYLVTYVSKEGVTKEVSTFEIVYKPVTT